MRLVELLDRNRVRAVINVDHISSFRLDHGTVCIMLSSGESVHTMFTTIEAAIDFIFRAQSVILNGGNQ